MIEPYRMSEAAAPDLSGLDGQAAMPPVQMAGLLAAAVCACAVTIELVLWQGLLVSPWLGLYALLVLVPAGIWAAKVAIGFSTEAKEAGAVGAETFGLVSWLPLTVVLALPALLCLFTGSASRLLILCAAMALYLEVLARIERRWQARTRAGLIATGLSDGERSTFAEHCQEIAGPWSNPRSFDQIYVAASAENDGQWRRFLTRAALSDVPITPAAVLLENLTGRIDIDGVDAGRRAGIAENAKCRSNANAHIQRALDIVIGGLGCIALSPIIALTALTVAVSMGRPVLFVQPRIGQNGRVFQMYKFRSMKVNGDANVIATANGDQRVTPLGRILRRTRLDELPQLWNILIGDMTLIGPRPEQPVLVERYTQLIPNYDLRHLVKPGLTGWSQVRYGYAATVAETRGKLAYDLYYVDNKSLALDLQILARTVAVMFDSNLVR